jgi:NADPH-dependent curcumin reductase CurA
MKNHLLRLARRPHGPIEEDTFAMHEEELPPLREGQFLVRTIYLSIDPSLRGQLVDVPSYVPPVQIGETMRGFGAGEVVDSRHPGFAKGDSVTGSLGWQTYCVASGNETRPFRKVTPGTSLVQAVSVLGTTGLTAYFGLLDIGRPKPDETVVVSGAAGATGSVAGQIAKIAGCRVVGIAGSADKCAWLTGELGLDAAINYREERVGRRLRELCPRGVDVFFDNVGGPILDSTIACMNVRGRIVACGTISTGYGEGSRADPIQNYFLFAPRRIRMEGFLVTDFQDRFPAALDALSGWVAGGRLKSRETVLDGLEQAPRALREIFEGKNVGKMLVKVASAASAGSSSGS